MQSQRILSAVAFIALAVMVVVGEMCLGDDPLTKTDVFISGTDGYHTYRIPAIVTTPEGTLLAFCEGRKTSRSDHGDLDLVLRRSTDGGTTWAPMQIVYEEGGDARVTIGNPCPWSTRIRGASGCRSAETTTTC